MQHISIYHQKFRKTNGEMLLQNENSQLQRILARKFKLQYIFIKLLIWVHLVKIWLNISEEQKTKAEFKTESINLKSTVFIYKTNWQLRLPFPICQPAPSFSLLNTGVVNKQHHNLSKLEALVYLWQVLHSPVCKSRRVHKMF